MAQSVLYVFMNVSALLWPVSDAINLQSCYHKFFPDLSRKYFVLYRE